MTQTLARYLVQAQNSGKRRAAEPGMVITLDHGITLTVLAVNGRDIDGGAVDVFFPNRTGDNCAMNDLSIAMLLEYGDFRYLISGDLTGGGARTAADVEELIIDDAADVDVYHVNHHGSETSSSMDFLQAVRPTVAVCSNAKKHDHPRKDVVEDRLFTLSPRPAVYLTNKPAEGGEAWQAPDSCIADLYGTEYEGIVEIMVWTQTYRVFEWRNGKRLDWSHRYAIKER